MIKKLCILIFFFGFSVNALISQEYRTISGKVYLKENNHLQNTMARGIAGIYLSDGEHIFKTDKSGNFNAKIQSESPFFVIVPGGYKMDNTSWYRSIPKDGEQINFELQKESQDKNFNFLAIGDVQVGSREEMNMADVSFFREIANRDDYDFGLYLGDLVNDNTKIFHPLLQSLNSISKPYRVVYGNHDWEHGASHDLQDKPFETDFGPKNYAFERGNVLFITLNSIYPVGKYGYKGIYKAETISFVKELLGKVLKKNQLIIINQHIPLRWMKNKNEFLDLLNIDHEVLVLSGHTHSISRYFYERNGRSDIQEVVCGAVSGNWWTGQKNWEALPLALMKDGSPRGYFKVSVFDNNYKLNYKAVGLDPGKQMNFWFGSLNNRFVANTIDSISNKFILNFFAGSEKTEIKVYSGNHHIGNMEKHRMVDPYIARIKRFQDENIYPNELSKKSPYLSTPSSHIWTMDMKNLKSEEFNSLRIEINDPFIESFNYSVNFWNSRM
ncbi:calcineurin-like phosphoesterase family protein [Zunongwangia sp. HGR-M22]|uniref:calcineurin-like phosphoesterase family protein n=1 Tax=Zunongwangia sp. HGR-M22 TaxID=3015168 RepID=UPI0022DDB2BB|nr:calcineurin-like phosphoesterase family protein [Zunongwangia sp. HGR-M22]WBL26723.1 calcineurin-like phosphoesterase family protein [Zunongwangia sp. HGR-M22]